MANSGGFQRGSRKDSGKEQRREKSEDSLEEKVLFVNRCAKVVKGGRKFSFSALIAVGDGKGRVGFGFSKANELTDAIRRAGELARANMITIEMEGDTIPHEVEVCWDGARLLFRPAMAGTGLIAGSQPRSILGLAGVKDIVVKSLGNNNPVNLTRATFKAFESLRNRSQTLALRSN